MSLSPTARALLDAARDGLAPDAAALRRVRGRIDAAVAGGGAAVGGGGALAIKLSVVAVIAVVAGAVIVNRDAPLAVAPELVLAAPAVVEQREVRVHEPSPPPRAPALEIEIELPPAPARARGAPRAPIVAAPPAAEPVTLTRPIDLAREVELVDAAMAALRRGDATAALASVRVHREETRGAGQLAEDAAAIEIEALCRLRDRRVAAKLEAFDARWPDSAQRSRLTTSCP